MLWELMLRVLECHKSLMLWELELRVLDKSAMPLQAYRLRPTGLCIQTNKLQPTGLGIQTTSALVCKLVKCAIREYS